ncbi:MAG: DNA-binding protein [Bacteroidia bacterium]|nr:DNA-binding protein [Bacteroidia bacterium]
MKSISYLVLALALLTGCNNAKVKKTENKPSDHASMLAPAAPVMHTVVAKDVIQTSKYTYLLLTEDGKEYWAAVSRFEAAKGKTYYYNVGMEMKNFQSKELNRTFETIQFIQEFGDQPIQEKVQAPLTTKGRQSVDKVDGIKVEPVAGGVKLADLFANKANYAGKKVKVTGQVVKFSPEIMSKNWIHLQDGSEANGSYDLTITTMETVAVGTVVTLEGVLAIDKDFGYGYKYDLILEESKLIK